MAAAKNRLNGVRQFIAGVGFDDVSERSFRKGFFDDGRLVQNRNEDNAGFRMRVANTVGGSKSADARHRDVADDQVRHIQLHGSHQCTSIWNHVNVVIWIKQRAKMLGHLRVILGQDETCAHHIAVFLSQRLRGSDTGRGYELR